MNYVRTAILLAGLTALFMGTGLNFIAATIVATLAAMTFNFFLNNSLTYRERLEITASLPAMLADLHEYQVGQSPPAARK